MSFTTLRTATRERVRWSVFTRAREYNTITLALRDELGLGMLWTGRRAPHWLESSERAGEGGRLD